MIEMTNADRAEFARPALELFIKTVKGEVNDMQTNIQDLIGDLLHLARREAGADDLSDLLERALYMHDTEVREDPEE